MVLSADARDLFRAAAAGGHRRAAFRLALAALARRSEGLSQRNTGSAHDGCDARRYRLVTLNSIYFGLHELRADVTRPQGLLR